MQAEPHQPPCPRDGIVKRALWLFGAHTLLSQTGFLAAYYLLPEGILRNSPQAAAAHAAARASSFAGELALTLAFNLLGVALVAVLMNCNQVRGVPVGYLYPLFLGVFSGLLAGSNSFTNSDLSLYDVRDGTALAYTIGGLEMLGYVLVVASTVRCGVYQYRSWWRWTGEWAPVKVMRLRDVRLQPTEWAGLALGLLLIVVGAYNETVMAWTT